MNIETIITVIGALGGFELVKFLYQSLVNRKTDRRREIASVEKEEVNVQSDEIENLRKLQEHHNLQIKAKEDKISELWDRIKVYRDKELEMTKTLNERDLEIQLMKIYKCEVRGCAQRKPPSDY
jgi:TolA-binding protein